MDMRGEKCPSTVILLVASGGAHGYFLHSQRGKGIHAHSATGRRITVIHHDPVLEAGR